MKTLLHLKKHQISKKEQQGINGGENACESACVNSCYHFIRIPYHTSNFEDIRNLRMDRDICIAECQLFCD